MTEYFVSQTGQDSNSGDRTNPFATISKAATVAKAGDIVSIDPGIYREAVRPAASGTASAPITFRGLGKGVVISGADVITTPWNIHKDNIHKTQLTPAFNRGIGQNQIWVNGEMMQEARWPSIPDAVNISRDNCALSTKGSVDLASKTSDGFYTATYEHPGLNFPVDFFKDAYIFTVPGWEWWASVGQVVGSEPGKVTFRYKMRLESSPDTHKATANNPFYIFGNLNCLDAEKEWYFDSSGMLYLCFPGKTTTGKTVEIKRRDILFDLAGRSYINVENIEFFGGRINTDDASINLTFDRLNLKYCSHSLHNSFGWAWPGIVLRGSSHQATNNNIAYTSGAAISAGGSGHAIKNNVCHHTGLSPVHSDDGISIRGEGTDFEVANNTAFTTAGMAIGFGAKRSKFHHNHCFANGTQVTDIATFNAYDAGDLMGTEVAYNLVRNNYAYDNPAETKNGGTGIRGDSGGGVKGVSNFSMHHNIIVGMSRQSISLFSLKDGHLNYGNAKILCYSNTCEDKIIFATYSGQSHAGTTVKDNIAYSFGFLKEIPAGVTISGNLLSFANGIPGNQEGLAGSLNPLGFDFRLKDGVTHSKGAIAPKEKFVAGAIATISDIAACQILADGKERSKLIFNNMPAGRTFPEKFAVKIGTQVIPVTSCYVDIDPITAKTTGYVRLNLAALPSGMQQVSVTEDGTNWIDTRQSVDLGAAIVSSVQIQNGQMKIYGKRFFTQPFSLIPIELNLGIQDLNRRPIPLFVDFATLIRDKKVPSNGDGMKFVLINDRDEIEDLNYWIDGTFNTDRTLCWVGRDSAGYLKGKIEVGTNCQIFLAYGNAAWKNASNRQKTLPFLPTDAGFWVKSTDFKDRPTGTEVERLIDNSTFQLAANQSIPQKRAKVFQGALPAIQFDGVDDSYLLGDRLGSSAYSIYATIANSSPGATKWQRMWSSGRNDVLDYQAGSAGTVAVTSDGTVIPQPNIAFMSAASREPKDLTSFTIGANKNGTSFFKGNLFELMVFRRVLEYNESQDLKQHYLNLKYNLAPVGTGSLNESKSSHPLRVFVGDLECQVREVSPDEIICEPPVSASSFYDVTVRLPDGESLILKKGFPND